VFTSEGFGLNKYKYQKEEAEIRTLLSIVVDDIKYAKNKQWSLTYYVLLTYAALIGFCNLLGHYSYCENLLIKLIIIFAAALVGLYGIYHLLDTHMRIAFYRIRLTRIQNYLSREPQAIIDIRPEDKGRYPEYYRYFWELTILLIFALLFGLGCVSFYLMKNTLDITFLLKIIGIGFLFIISAIIKKFIFDCKKVNTTKEKVIK
jgi:hypothetical protein